MFIAAWLPTFLMIFMVAWMPMSLMMLMVSAVLISSTTASDRGSSSSPSSRLYLAESKNLMTLALYFSVSEAKFISSVENINL